MSAEMLLHATIAASEVNEKNIQINAIIASSAGAGRQVKWLVMWKRLYICAVTVIFSATNTHTHMFTISWS